MFWKIFVFEAQNRLRRPAVYVYFFAVLLFVTFSFSTGSLPAGEKEHFNSPMMIARTYAWLSIIMMLVTSAIMGMPLYKDIAYNTKDYYLTYPITKAGYFWGRYCSSVLFVLIIGSAVMFGAYIGTFLGPLLGLNDAARYGPNNLRNYLQPFFMIGIPNLVFTSSLFYGLVALTRNIKVIYSSGIILFLAYLIATFFLAHSNNETVIKLADPFAFNGIRMQVNEANDQVKNTTTVSFEGVLLINRLLWPGIGLGLLLFSYIKFNFEDFFSGKGERKFIPKEKANRNARRPEVSTSFTGRYNFRTLLTLTKTELSNIIRDNYFWIIIGSGLTFLGFIFYLGDDFYHVPNLPRTVSLMVIFYDNFLFFIFFIIIFYTGETVHRDRITRYAYIYDSLPAPNWVLNGSRLLSLLIMGAFLSTVPMFLGVFIQIIKGYYYFNIPVYLLEVFVLMLPRFLEMVVFAYFIHVIINNKFAAHGLGIAIWIILFFAHVTGVLNYNLLLYSYPPNYSVSDMDGIGHMLVPVMWFNLYWLLAAGLLIIISALFYYRGISSAFKERWQLASGRFNRKTKWMAVALTFCFLAVGSFIYYNVSYLNNYLTGAESDQRAVDYERTLKRYENLPLPKLTGIKLVVDLFPDKQQARTHGYFVLTNKTDKPIDQMLLDGEGVDYTLKSSGKDMAYTVPLTYVRGKFNWFRPQRDTADFRIYRFDKALAPRDSIVLEMTSAVKHKGFQNSSYSGDILNNGTYFSGGIPGLGYDEGEELGSNYERKRFGLAPKTDKEISQDDPIGKNTLIMGSAADLYTLDITVSTSGDQIAVAPGELKKKWKLNGRNYFHYMQQTPAAFPSFKILSGRYSVASASVRIDSVHNVKTSIYYHPAHASNTRRFMEAMKDGLRYYSKVYGAYPYKDLRLAETNVYSGGSSSYPTLNTYNENTGWNADFSSKGSYDYCYYDASKLIARQWWIFQTPPNSTVGGQIISTGLPKYDAFVMMERKYGKDNMGGLLHEDIWNYLFWHSRGQEAEHPLIKANQWYEWDTKAAQVLYGLRDLIGDENINAALKAFKNEYAFKKAPPYAGSNDLYRYLKMHTPDSLQYYVKDTWEKITFYNNKIVSVTASRLGKNNYKVSINLNAEKSYVLGKGRYVTTPMDDYIDLAVFAATTNDKGGRTLVNPLYIKKHKLKSGKHTIILIVKGKPVSVGIDPYGKLIDEMPNDNIKNL
jgi:ABC-2 type transport system permease protein